MKNKKKINQGIMIGSSAIIILTIITMGITSLFDYLKIKATEAAIYTQYPATVYKLAEINVKRQKSDKNQEILMREWVLDTFEKAGIDRNKIDCLIQNESGWNNWKYNINKDGSTDFGLLMINSVHKDTASVKCRWDYKCSTYWAINKILNDGNMDAWYGYRNNCK